MVIHTAKDYFFPQFNKLWVHKNVKVSNSLIKESLVFFINSIIENMPTLHHYSWYSIKRKINDYNLLWGKHWNELFGANSDDTSENNIMFDKPWTEVTEEDMVELATLYEKELGGWIFHRPVDWSNKTTWIQKQWSHTEVMNNWNSNKIV